MNRVNSVSDCISDEEKKQRTSITIVNSIVWLLLTISTAATLGIFLVVIFIVWFTNWLLSELNVRKLQLLGTSVSPEQFPEVYTAAREACTKLGVEELPRIIVINSGEMNAFALKFARKRVIVLLSRTLEGIIDNPAELRFLLGHELAHNVLNHGWRGTFEIYTSPAYKAAREMTCDNCGLAAADDISMAKQALKRLAVGNELYTRIKDKHLEKEAEYIYSGLAGWLLKQQATYPSFGRRISNIDQFAKTIGIQAAG
ncbi:MAG: M48 family metallopeptidase [Candidatus Brocadiia bacterium]